MKYCYEKICIFGHIQARNFLTDICLLPQQYCTNIACISCILTNLGIIGLKYCTKFGVFTANFPNISKKYFAVSMQIRPM